MKKVTAFLLCVIVLMSALSLCAFAAEPIDTHKNGSITFDYHLEGLEIKTYRIAEAFADGTFALTGDFKDYPVNIYGITSKAEWKNIASTLSSYIAADGILPDFSGTTDKDGKVFFENAPVGLYLTLSVRAETEDDISVFEDFITVLPTSDENGYNYDISAFPKCEEYVVKPDKIEYKVVKQWKDNGYAEKRPEKIEVEIIKNGKVESTQYLTAENNWCYSWSADDDGSVWQAVERKIPDGYTVTTVKNSSTIIITNAYDYGDPDSPQTGDTSVVWPYILIMCFSGIMMILIAIRGKKHE